MHGTGGAGAEAVTLLNNIVMIVRTPMSGTDLIANEAGKQSDVAEWLNTKGEIAGSIVSTRRQCVHVRLHALLVIVGPASSRL